MGDPRKKRKQYTSPGHPYEKARLESELILVGKYGLRNKRELWRARTKLANFRAQTRSLLALEEEEREDKEKILNDKLTKLGIIAVNTETDEILGLDVERILKRRLQTRVFERGLAGTFHQARQIIAHRHITVNGRVMTSPGYLVPIALEDTVEYAKGSPFADETHAMASSLHRESSIVEITVEKDDRRRRR